MNYSLNCQRKTADLKSKADLTFAFGVVGMVMVSWRLGNREMKSEVQTWSSRIVLLARADPAG